MDQMQNVLLTMLQTVSTPKVEQQREPSGESADSSFRKLLGERTEQVSREEGAQPNQPKEETQTAGETEKGELDEVQLQELAAMQMFCAANVQTVTVPEQESQVNQAVQGLTVPVEGAEAEVAAQELTQGVEQRGTQVPVEQTVQQEEVSTVEQKPVENVENAFQAQTQEQSEGKAEVKPEAKTADAPVKTVDTDTETSTVVEGEVENPVFRQVETAPVKVSETAAPPETETAEPVETQIADKITQAVANGEKRVEVQLTPEHLGKITVEVTQRGDGSLHIALHAENHQTRSLLERDISGLQTVLARGTQQEVQVEVPRQQENQQNQFQDGGHQHSRQQQQEQKHQRQSSEDFLNQLRLGLVSLDEVQS